MKYEVNDLAIILAKKIDSEIMRSISQLNPFLKEKDIQEIRSAPNFFIVRALIVTTLEEYMDVLRIQTTSSPLAEREYTPEILAKIRDHEIRKVAAQTVEAIASSPDYFKIEEYAEEWDRFKIIDRSIVVLRTGKIFRDARWP